MEELRPRPALSARALVATFTLLVASALAGQELPPGETTAQAAPVLPALEIHRTAGAISIDGELGDPGWEGATPITTWFETRPGDNVTPKVENVAWLAYDDEFFYAAFRFGDPEPQKIKAPLGDRDNVPSYTDYGGVIVDPRNDGQTAQMFLANPRGIQYDALSSDASGEDSAPDFFWESAGRITANGWQLEIRIPFSSLRYSEKNPEQWRIMLYRNWPREFRYQMFTNRLPRDSSCFICNTRPLVGLADLPSGGHWVAAPYVTAMQLQRPEGELGSDLESEDPEAEIGLDAKWIPNPDTVIDATINPDFSQIESDVAQIAANERFALFFPEKRPFFLESTDLLSTPYQAVYTRTITAPRWGGRATGEQGDGAYTALIGEDRGGGVVILPGPYGSGLAFQDFESTVAIARYRHRLGPRQSFVSALYTGREIDGGAYNRVLGPDFRWQPTDQDSVSGQLLFSRSETPNRPDLAAEWDGRELSGHAARISWYRAAEPWDFYANYEDLDDEFRADNGFIPEVGLRRVLTDFGYTFRFEDKPISRLRTFVVARYNEDRDGELIDRLLRPGFGLDGLWNSFVRVELAMDRIGTGQEIFDREQVRYWVEASPTRRIARVNLFGIAGEEIDFANHRLGDGLRHELSADLRPTDHLQIALNAARRTVDVTTDDGRSGRLFTADVARIRANYTFNASSWLRVIGQWVETDRDPSLYEFEVSPRDAGFGGSVVFAYKLNWQSVLYAGYADNRALSTEDHLEPADRQIFLKVSYAFQG